MQLLRKTGATTSEGAAEFIVADSQWLVLDAESIEAQSAAARENTAALAVGLTGFAAEPGVWTGRKAPWTLVIEPADELVDLSVELREVVLAQPEILVSFPAFTDGRGYSHATTLRQHYGFAGDLIAVGDVRRDQLDFMHQSGFTAFEITSNSSVDDMLMSLSELSMPTHRLYSGAGL